MVKGPFGGRLLSRVVLLACAVALSCSAYAADAQWYRGQLHAHSYWSDGHAFPEQAVAVYKDRGYNFLCLTEHNRFAESSEEWRDVMPDEGGWPPEVGQAMFDAYLEAFGEDWVETRPNGGLTAVRLKTYDELKARFEDPGAFILLPGVEATQTLDGNAVHQNYVNLPALIPSIQGRDLVKDLKSAETGLTVSKLVALNAAEAAQVSAQLERPHLLMLNHPFWVYYDIVPQNLIDNPEVRFFEVCNGGSQYAPHPDAASYTPEKFWDAVNAFRRLNGQPLLYGVASDDAHYYDSPRIDGNGGVGAGWVMVRAEALTPEHVIGALNRGDFYATSGVLLDEVAFTREDQTLHVHVKPEDGMNYRIEFVTTRRGFDQTVTEVASPALEKRPARSVPVYSEDIGRVAHTIDGTAGEYRLAPDDLYVRARVISDSPSTFHVHFHPATKMAWTQPYVAGQ